MADDYEESDNEDEEPPENFEDSEYDYDDNDGVGNKDVEGAINGASEGVAANGARDW